MPTAAWLLYLTGAYPLWRAWRSNWHTSLFQAVHWAVAAWLAWGGLMVATIFSGSVAEDPIGSYLTLCFTGCAGVAVLGARRPGVGAWNFVLLGLLAVMLLPLLENQLAPRSNFDPLRIVFVAGTVAVGVLNYLPTRLAPAALMLGAAAALQLPVLSSTAPKDIFVSWWLLALVPWIALAGWRSRPRARAEFDRLWLDFRDRFGFLWAQRIREQFNRSAANAGWPVVLRWQGLRITTGSNLPGELTQADILATLQSLLKRFCTV